MASYEKGRPKLANSEVKYQNLLEKIRLEQH